MDNITINLSLEDIEELKRITTGELNLKIIKQVNKRLSSITRKQRQKEKKEFTKKVSKIENVAKHKRDMVSAAETFKEKLKKKQTPSERIFKARLKANNIRYEFQRIVYDVFKFYIIDFYLPDYGLIVEIDGGYHEIDKQKTKDKLRTEHLNRLGYKRILRLTNEEATNSMDALFVEKINKFPKLQKLETFKEESILVLNDI